MTVKEASDITAGNRPAVGWSEDFPGEGDVIAARYAKAETGEPWRIQWLIVADGLASGTIGFKGDPVQGRLEVGYGVVSSQRGRGVATSALAQLLALLEGTEFIVGAETAAWNLASQSVLRHLGFAEVGRRFDRDEGVELVTWERRAPTAS